MIGGLMGLNIIACKRASSIQDCGLSGEPFDPEDDCDLVDYGADWRLVSRNSDETSLPSTMDDI
jgi:hypothetical protein